MIDFNRSVVAAHRMVSTVRLKAMASARRLLSPMIAVLAIAGSAAGQLARSTDDAAVEQWLRNNVNERGQRCEPHARRRNGDRVFAACGSAGIWELVLDPATGPRLLGSHPVEGDAVGFFEEPDGRVWVKVESLRAQPLDSLLTTPAPSPSSPAQPAWTPPPPPASGAATQNAWIPPPAPAPSQPEEPLGRSARPEEHLGRVIAIGEGEVTVSLGARHGVMRGMRIELSAEHREPLAGGQSVVSRQPIAVGVVTAATDDFSIVELGLNETVPLGAVAERTHAAPTSSLSAPPRAGGYWEAQFMARPFIALEEFGGGILLSASVGRRFEGDWHVMAQIDPLGLGDARDHEGSKRNGIVAMSGFLIGSYDSKFLEMGLGFGGQTVNSPTMFVNPGSGLAVAQVLRLGTLDGTNLAARSSIALFHSEFAFTAFVIAGQIAVGRRYWLLLGGGGGDIGYAYGELGLRALLGGNGGPGSTFLTATAGGAGVFKEGSCDANFQCTDYNEYIGPMAGIGAEWRF